MSISLSKWPMLPTIAWCFIRAMCFGGDDVLVAGGGDEDVGRLDDVLERDDLVALHRGLQRADRVDLGDHDAGALAAQRLGAALADVAVAADDGDLAADHHVGGAVDAVDQRVAAAVEVVELRLGDRVVDVDRREQQRRRWRRTGRAGARRSWSPRSRPGCCGAMRVKRSASCSSERWSVARMTRCSSLSALVGIRHGAGLLVLDALVDEQRDVAAVVEDHVRALAVGPAQRLLRAPPVLLERLALPGEDGDAGLGDRRRGVVLGREDVAASTSGPRRREQRASRSAPRSGWSCAASR